MHIEKLRLVGFKSFVEATELAIEPGLTGIVGPNGCGKSNLVEAVRWVMGETSARRLRAGEMDDLIFGGTAARPARNIAEVALSIDNSGRAAPAFNDREQIEIVRRIERGGGSSYRINGREARARDVQLLFADAASGAHSAALVSQGRIGALIDAKPAERRAVLEEAAGVAGLHARRRETELKLAAAEANLVRLDDVLATMATQLEALKKQARQAQRYRRLAEHIRRAEALLLGARWAAAAAEAARIESELRAAERAVADATERSLGETRRREAAEAELPPLRLAAAAASAELQRLVQRREALEDELKRVLAGRAEAERRLAQLAADGGREGEHVADATGALARLEAERDGLVRGDAEAAAAGAAVAARLAEADAELAEAEAVLQRATEAAASASARRAGLRRRRDEVVGRAARLDARRAEAEQQRAALAAATISPAALREAADAVAEAAARAEGIRTALDAAERDVAAARAAEEAARDAARAVEGRHARLKAEADALQAVLAPAAEAVGGDRPPILDRVGVEPGFEAAVGAVFDDELAAPLDGGAGEAHFWLSLPPLAAVKLPDGARPLLDKITAPPALARRLAHAGWVEDVAAGHRLQPALAPGQRLVDRSGRLWRWDGYTRLAAAPSASARQLQQRNRLQALAVDIAVVEEELREAAAVAAAASAAHRQAADLERLQRAQARDAEAALAVCQTAENELARRGLATETRLAAIVDALDKLAAEAAEAQAQIAETDRELAGLPEDAATGAAVEKAREIAAAARLQAAEARAARERVAREAAARRDRLASIAGELRAWSQRRDAATAQLQVLAERRQVLEGEIAALDARPAAIAAEAEDLGGAIAAAGHQVRRSGDALAVAETRLREAQEGCRQVDRLLAEARERRARLDGLRDGAGEAQARLAREIRERLDAAPQDLPELAGLAPGEPLPDPAQTAARLDRLIGEREAMGPVNLVAESEAAEVAARIDGLARERTELTEAIARLRRGIAALDQEGRKRLLDAFERVNRHFAELFAKLFGGGKAHLELVGDADPLDAGLEIMASPPGKRLQLLSLLSGGEQALTALALLFAVFLTNPAPICVLDEVDAPLDDPNVDRLCALVGEIADTALTRFLIVTHHRITMARVDRLFGVTMAERGVSQLVSVDLARAAQLRQTA